MRDRDLFSLCKGAEELILYFLCRMCAGRSCPQLNHSYHPIFSENLPMEHRGHFYQNTWSTHPFTFLPAPPQCPLAYFTKRFVESCRILCCGVQCSTHQASDAVFNCCTTMFFLTLHQTEGRNGRICALLFFFSYI